MGAPRPRNWVMGRILHLRSLLILLPGAVRIYTPMSFVTAPNVWETVLGEQVLFKKPTSSEGI